MIGERTIGGTCDHPFPLYPELVETLAAAHLTVPAQRDATVAHVLGTYAGYAYADTNTISTMMVRVGFERHACVRISQTVDAMFIFSTAYLVQSRCGRVVILCYRGTETGARIGRSQTGCGRSTHSASRWPWRHPCRRPRTRSNRSCSATSSRRIPYRRSPRRSGDRSCISGRSIAMWMGSGSAPSLLSRS